MLSCAKKIALALVLLSLFAACSQDKNSLSGFYGEDARYFEGLAALKENDFEKAKKKFSAASKKAGYWAARKSFQELCLLGDVRERIKKCSEFCKKYNDDDALFFVCREFAANNEWTKVIETTDSINLAECDNKLCVLRLQALAKKNDSRYKQSVYDWFAKRRVSEIHYDFYRQTARDELEEVFRGAQDERPRFSDFEANLDFVLQFRIAIYRANYNAAFEMLDQMRALAIEKKSIPFTYQLLADMGRACVNGSNDDIKNARYFAELSKSDYWDKKINYYAMIYSGLLYNKNDNYRRRALKQFEAALDLAGDDSERDQALWYYLQACLKISTQEAVAGLEKYASSFRQKEYFDDFFDSLSVLLFSGGNWEGFERVLAAIKDFASQATVSKYAYLAARVMESQMSGIEKNKIESYYSLAAQSNSGTFVYYKLLAAKQLGLTTQEIERLFFAPTENGLKSMGAKKIEDKSKSAKQAETLGKQKNAATTGAKQEMSSEQIQSARKLLLGYADFGFGERIYDEWKFFYDKDPRMIDLESAARLSGFLRKMDNGQNDYYSKSLRMIARAANLDDIQISRAAFELLYPQNFLSQIQDSAKEFEVADYLMFALVRTESFFESRVQSHAGAIGLTQLMEATAADCAKRLKVDDYNLLDPATNIRFGTYYYSQMKKRLNDSGVLALFAYNAGITVVRRWIKSSRIELNSQGSLWSDLFLETLPFAETRDYGRRVVSAAAMYAWLYYGKNPCDIVNELM